MKKTILLVTTIAALCVLSTFCEAMEIVTVDVQRVLDESVPGKAAAEHVKKAQEILQKSMDEVIKLNEGKKTDEARNSVTQGRTVLQRQLEIERQAAINTVTAEMVKVVQAWVNKNSNVNGERILVLPRASFIAVSSNADITDQIIKDMENVVPEFADLPKVTVTPAKSDYQKDELPSLRR